MNEATIGELAEGAMNGKMVREEATQAPSSITLGPATMERIARIISQDPAIQAVLVSAIEASGAETNANWKLSLQGVLTVVQG